MSKLKRLSPRHVARVRSMVKTRPYRRHKKHQPPATHLPTVHSHNDYLTAVHHRQNRRWMMAKYVVPALALLLILMSGATLAAKQLIGKPAPITISNNTVKKPKAIDATPQKTVSSPAKKPSSSPAQTPLAQQTPTSVPVVPDHSPGVGLPNSVPVYNSAGFDFYYIGGRQFVDASGASARFTQVSPLVPNTAASHNHSLIELSAQSTDGMQIVEVGWMVDTIMNGDPNPHLFVYHWVSGSTSCYNACGFVQVSNTHVAGESVPAGATGDYQINFTDGNWNIYYNGDLLGYYPGSLWNNSFTRVGFVQVFGEVALNSTGVCIQMGNGSPGSSSGSAEISNFTLLGSSGSALLNPYATLPSSYTYGSVTDNGLHLGGPGTC